MSTVVIGGLDSHASSDVVTNYCQKFGRLLNCYVNAGQCIVTFANHLHATEFVRAAPHQIGSSSQVTACWKTTLQQNAPRPSSDSHDHCRVTVRGTLEQLQQNSLLQYFSRYGQVRMCLPNPAQGCATVTFTDRTSCERVLKEPRHFLNGRSLIVEVCTDTDNGSPPKRMKVFDPVISSSSNRVEQDKQQAQLQARLQWCEYEKQQLSNLLSTQYAELTQQLTNCQVLLKQSLEELLSKDKQIEQLKQENKNIDELLRQSVHDNEQQQIHAKRREEVHSQTKRKYEELYKAYTKLKDNCAIQRDKDVTVILDSVPSSLSNGSKSKAAIDGVRKRL